ncbi:hypothetical protein SYNPS1DRAFT_28321 [Syncephalis pseudoplumigaleata]|uniref:Uncharacterized protein n=1 Tax=Syncephalis pseudoplumigaleata TaxID=1712513 RepID=A0A4P9Z0H6_9FUNG|nr:hypothetical protein SYNPS1DRAFT_28321 [Syncephalis pseudoplumigaleata]|eukprot:RKP25963.1 hypothetical protein SYNPS1DRAFT_28321 [Syncephalis pseudoplumigaleata]
MTSQCVSDFVNEAPSDTDSLSTVVEQLDTGIEYNFSSSDTIGEQSDDDPMLQEEPYAMLPAPFDGDSYSPAGRHYLTESSDIDLRASDVHPSEDEDDIGELLASMEEYYSDDTIILGSSSPLFADDDFGPFGSYYSPAWVVGPNQQLAAKMLDVPREAPRMNLPANASEYDAAIIASDDFNANNEPSANIPQDEQDATPPEQDTAPPEQPAGALRMNRLRMRPPTENNARGKQPSKKRVTFASQETVYGDETSSSDDDDDDDDDDDENSADERNDRKRKRTCSDSERTAIPPALRGSNGAGTSSDANEAPEKEAKRQKLAQSNEARSVLRGSSTTAASTSNDDDGGAGKASDAAAADSSTSTDQQTSESSGEILAVLRIIYRLRDEAGIRKYVLAVPPALVDIFQPILLTGCEDMVAETWASEAP